MTNKRQPEILQLRADIEKQLCRSLQSPNDFQYLIQQIWKSKRSEIESALFDGEGIRTTELTINDRIEVTWQPNRRCVFRYVGGQRFVVEESMNSKLHEGDSFDAVCFIVQHPMYLDNLQLADGTRTSYVAGKKNGLTSAKKI